MLGGGYFRVTRDADLELAERESIDLVTGRRGGPAPAPARQRRGAPRGRARIVCIPESRDPLMRELRLEPDEVYEPPGLLDLGDLMEIVELDRPDLKDPPWTPRR